MSKTCLKCFGVLHVKTDSGWISCGCRKQEIAGSLDLGLRTLIDGKPQDEKGILKRLEEHLEETGGKVFLVTGKDGLFRWKVIYCVLRRILSRQPIRMGAVDFNDYVAWRFTDKPSIDHALAAFDGLLWLKLDFLRNHDWNEILLRELLSRRANRKTIISAPTEFSLNGFSSQIHMETVRVENVQWIGT